MLLPWMACHGRNRALGRQASYIQTSGPRGLAHTRGSGVYRPGDRHYVLFGDYQTPAGDVHAKFALCALMAFAIW